ARRPPPRRAGLVLPPRVAPVQAVVVPIPGTKDSSEEEKAAVVAAAAGAGAALRGGGGRPGLDDRGNYSPGGEVAHWEQKGVPLRVEVGPRDAAAGVVTVVRRDTGAKATLPAGDAAGLAAAVTALLATVQADMLEGARRVRDAHVASVTEWPAFV